MSPREHPIVWVIGATRSCKSVVAEYGIAPLGFKHISTSTYFRERYAKPDTYNREFVFSISEFAAECLKENPDCHADHLKKVFQIAPQPYVIEGERNPDEFAKLYDPQRDMVIFVDRLDIEKYPTVIEVMLPKIEEDVRELVNNGDAHQDSVIKLTFGGPNIKAERFGANNEHDILLFEGVVKDRKLDGKTTEDLYPWIHYVNKITSDAVKGYYGIEIASRYDTPVPAVTSSRRGPWLR